MHLGASARHEEGGIHHNLYRTLPKAQTEILNTPSTYQREGEERESFKN